MCTPFNGCPPNTIQCVSGACDDDCADNCPQGDLCWDGVCAASCLLAPSLDKPIQFEATIPTTEAAVIEVPSVGGRTLATVQIPIGAINAGSESVSILILPVADSVIRGSTSPSWTTSDPISNILSTPIDIQVPPQVAQPLSIGVDISFTVTLTGSLTVNDLCLATLSGSGQWICQDVTLNPSTVGSDTIATGTTNTLGTVAVVKNVPEGTSQSNDKTRDSGGQDHSNSDRSTYSLLLIAMALYLTKM